jgi:hypothetical protein
MTVSREAYRCYARLALSDMKLERILVLYAEGLNSETTCHNRVSRLAAETS